MRGLQWYCFGWYACFHACKDHRSRWTHLRSSAYRIPTVALPSDYKITGIRSLCSKRVNPFPIFAHAIPVNNPLTFPWWNLPRLAWRNGKGIGRVSKLKVLRRWLRNLIKFFHDAHLQPPISCLLCRSGTPKHFCMSPSFSGGWIHKQKIANTRRKKTKATLVSFIERQPHVKWAPKICSFRPPNELNVRQLVNILCLTAAYTREDDSTSDTVGCLSVVGNLFTEF